MGMHSQAATSSITHSPRAKSSPVSRAAKEAFCESVELYSNWLACQPEPTIQFEDSDLPISEVCRLVLGCRGPLPRSCVDTLRFCEVDVPTRTYASAAAAMLKAIRKMRLAH
jgi:hypothetical protein